MSDVTALSHAQPLSSLLDNDDDDDAATASADGRIKPEDLVPGRIVDGRFELLDVLGEGGWATVYLARQLHVERLVALKILTLRSDEHHDAFVERFRREAAAAARIRHPNIITVHDVGTLGLNRCPYIVMDLLDGHDLAEELTAAGPMDLERALRLMLPVVDAMAQAHEADIIHRDLKPSNLFLIHPGTAAERLVVVDFGIARIGRAVSRLTEGSSIFGTPAYLAPEWIEHRMATPAMDVYQLGLILVEALTGVPVVQDAVLYQCLQRHVDGTLRLPAHVMTGPLGPVLRRALARDVEARYQDCGELLRALLGVLDALPVDADALRHVATPGLENISGLLAIDDVAAAAAAAEEDTLDEGAPPAPVRHTAPRLPAAVSLDQGGITLDMHIDLDEDEEDEAEAGVAAFVHMTPPPATPLRQTSRGWHGALRVLAPMVAVVATVAFVWLWSPAPPFEGGEANAQTASTESSTRGAATRTARPAALDGDSLARVPLPDAAPAPTAVVELGHAAASQGARGAVTAPAAEPAPSAERRLPRSSRKKQARPGAATRPESPTRRRTNPRATRNMRIVP